MKEVCVIFDDIIFNLTKEEIKDLHNRLSEYLYRKRHVLNRNRFNHLLTEEERRVVFKRPPQHVTTKTDISKRIDVRF